ncbi:C2H2 type zinc-finger-domain-containing protein [Fusarium acuminatum]|uniref:C2H2 type zinc-finger-domain-containing protein n=1 Tax=Fusarium acuminatum TaxID=5515 RepID=A0ABZ2X215_9HYPO
MADISVVDDQQQQSLRVAQAPSFCRLCDIEMRGLQTWKAHIKSDGHVEFTPKPPHSTRSTSPRRKRNDGVVDFNQQDRYEQANEDTEDEDEDEDENEISTSEFIPGQCLFCAQDSTTLDDSMKHMVTAHSFNVPFQDLLAVDLETIISYLHFVIHNYRECICCGTRRGTVEGIKHHMLAKGHCRFDISPETEEFYQIPEVENTLTGTQDPSDPVKLPSGKIISHRKHEELRAPRPSPDQKRLNPPEPAEPGTEIAHRRTVNGNNEIVQANEAILAAQLSRLKVTSDRAAQREEKRWRGRLERANNFFALKRFKLDAADGRMGRQF